MKRITAILAAVLIIISIIPKGKALSAADEGAGAYTFPGFEDLGSTKAALMDLDSGAVLYQKNGSTMAKPGSLTVIMSSVILIESTSPEEWDIPLPELTQVNSSWSGRAAQMGLKKGDAPTRRDLLHGMMLTGGADAVYVTEMLVSGSEAGFVQAMNDKAEELCLGNTRFENGFGLGSNGHYTCAVDMAVLTAYAMKNELFASVARTLSYTCSEGCRSLVLENTNPALSDSNCIGVKSGADSEKEHSLAIASEAGSARLIAVILEAPTDEKAASFCDRLISAGFSLYLTEGGLVSFTPTNALIKVKRSGTFLSKELSMAPSEFVSEGETLRAVGYHEFQAGMKLCVYRMGSLYWADAREFEFICFIDDLFIENGPALSAQYDKGQAIIPDAFVTSRHKIGSITVTLSLPDGTLAYKGEIRPMAHNLNSISGSEIATSVSALSIREGLYLCTVTAEALCAIPNFGESTLTKSETSTLAVGTGGACVSYNANMGVNSPEGECFFDSFTVPSDQPERAGYVFAGWNTLPDGSGIVYNAGESYTSDASLTLYAMWKPGEDSWSFDGRVLYDESLIVEGYAVNTAGITSMRLSIFGESGVVNEISSPACSNNVQLGELLIKEPITLPQGTYRVEIFGSAGGGTEKLLGTQDLLVGEAAAKTPEPATQEPDVTPEPANNNPGFSLAGLPIFVWFMIGAAVVAVLIWLIVYIIKKG